MSPSSLQLLNKNMQIKSWLIYMRKANNTWCFPTVSNMALKFFQKRRFNHRKDKDITWLGSFIGCHGKWKSLTLQLACFRGKETTKMPFFMTRKECFPYNHSWTHCTLYINSCSFPGKMFAVSYWAALRDPGNSAPADIQARVMKIMCSCMWWLLACQREPELAAKRVSAPRGLSHQCPGEAASTAWPGEAGSSVSPLLCSHTQHHPAISCHMSNNGCLFLRSQSKPEPWIFVRVSICQTGSSSKDTPVFAPTLAIQNTLHPACMTSITHLS